MIVKEVSPQQPITATREALDYLQRQVASHKAKGIRLGISKSGCSGYTWNLDWVTKVNEKDIILPIREDITLYLAADDLPLLHGTEIDYVTEGINSVIKFRNPNTMSECGCGESFALRSKDMDQ